MIATFDKDTLLNIHNAVLDGKGFILRVDGSVEEFNPNLPHGHGTTYHTPEVREKCGFDWFELVRMPGFGYLMIDEEGKLKAKSVNLIATYFFQKYTHTADVIVGDCLICSLDALK